MSIQNNKLEDLKYRLSRFKDNLNINLWFNDYFKSLFFIVRCYENCDKQYMKSYIQTFCNIIPNKIIREYFVKFFSFDKSVVHDLETNIDITSNSIKIFKESYKIFKSLDSSFLDVCLEQNNNELIAIYSYFMYNYIIYKRKYFGEYNLNYQSLKEIKDSFISLDLTKHPKGIWGVPTWKTMHYSSLFLPFEKETKYCKIFKNYLYVLQFVLPCKVCREHLKENLKNYPLDENNCGKEPFDVYKVTFELHNAVNRQTKGAKDGVELEFETSLELYIPEVQFRYRHNSINI